MSQHPKRPPATVAAQTLAGRQEVWKRVVWHPLAARPDAESIVSSIEGSFAALGPRDITPDFRLGAQAALVDLREVIFPSGDESP